MAAVLAAFAAIRKRVRQAPSGAWRPGPGMETLILQRRIALMYARLPTGIVLSVAVSSLLTLLLPASRGRGAMLLWGLASLAMGALRFADAMGYRSRPRDQDRPRPLLARLVLGAAAQGLLWGFLGWRMFPAEPVEQLFLTLVLTGMAGGGVVFLSPIHEAYVLFLLPLILPASVHLLASPLAMLRAVGALGFAYTALMVFASAKACRWAGDALRASLENAGLVDQLKAANAGLESHREQLAREVEERTLRLSRAVNQLREEIRDKEVERLRSAQSDARHLSLLQAINEGFGHVDAEEQFLFANPAAEKIFGVAPGTLVGRSLVEFLDPAGADLVREETARRREGLGNRYLCPIVRPDRVPRLLEVNASPIYDGAGRFLGASAVFEDITDRRRAEDELRTALTFNDQIISSANEGIIVYDLEGRYLLWNPFMDRLTGVPAQDVLGKLPGEVFGFAEEAGILRGIRKGLDGETAATPPFPWTVPATGRSGWATAVHAPMRGSAGEIIGVVETVSDMTEWKRVEQLQRQLELELHHAQKLESIGGLAGGIAHDMNNVLGAVQAIVQTLKLKHAGDPGLAPELDVIERAANRGRDLVKGLTNFVRKHLEEPEPLDLNELVREEMDLLGRTTLQKVTLMVDLEEPLAPVMGERGALGGALMNLCVNAMDAMDAMDGKGTLTLRTWSLPGDQIGLSVQDTGKGMPPEVLARALEPFFTTKAIGKGTGLGLSMVYATLKAHGGAVSIQSRVGEGTTVLLRLPAAPQPSRPAAEAHPAAPGTGPLRILQVDDDELILASIPVMLEHQGHRVETATGGQEALARLREGLEVDLVILDLNMPGMNGIETLQQLRALRPELPVLLATGYLDSGTEALLARSGRALSISKPFSMQDLDAMFRRLSAMAPGPSL